MGAKQRKWLLVFYMTAMLFGPLLGFSCHAAAENGAQFLQGKTVRIVVGYAPGGGYDAYARMLAPHLQSKLGTTVIVENRPGGGGLNALATLMREPGDGLHILLLNGEAAVLSALIEQRE